MSKANVGRGFSLANPLIYKKRVRLKDFDYKGCYRYFVTICTFGKKDLFCNERLVNWLINVLKEKSNSFGFKIWAYCFMPEHLHLLIEGRNPDSDMKRFISGYKQYTGYYYKRKSGQNLWQINFYDHILRREEDILSLANYIFENPVRRRLVGNQEDYKFMGSFEFDLEQP
jgi:putative transposase